MYVIIMSSTVHIIPHLKGRPRGGEAGRRKRARRRGGEGEGGDKEESAGVRLVPELTTLAWRPF